MMTADIVVKTDLERDIEFGEYINSCSEADKLLCWKVYDYEEEGYFDEMMFKPGSIVSKFIEFKYLSDDGSWKTSYEGIDISLESSYYRFYIKALKGCEGKTDPKERVIFISPEYADEESVILHEMIHSYEEIINEKWSFYKDIILICLYNDLKGKIADLDAKIFEHTHVVRGNEISTAGGSHDILFLLKSLDLDLRCNFELGTVCGYGRKEMFNVHVGQGTPE